MLCEAGDFAEAELLLQLGADVDFATPDGTTALLSAAERGDLDSALFLLRHGASIQHLDARKQGVEGYLRKGKLSNKEGEANRFREAIRAAEHLRALESIAPNGAQSGRPRI